MNVGNSPYSSQPQNPVILDRSNPLGAKVLVNAALTSERQFNTQGKRFVPTSTATFPKGQRGGALQGNATTGAGSFSVDLSTYTKITVAVSFFWDAYANDDQLMFEFGPNYNNNVAGYFIVDPNESSSSSFMVAVHTQTGHSAYGIPRPSANVWHRLVFSIDLAQNQALLSVYIDGVLQTLSAILTTHTASAEFFDNNQLFLLGRNNTSLGATGRKQVENLTIYSGVLGTGEVAQDYKNPYQIYRGRNLSYPLAIIAPTVSVSGVYRKRISFTAQPQYPALIDGRNSLSYGLEFVSISPGQPRPSIKGPSFTPTARLSQETGRSGVSTRFDGANSSTANSAVGQSPSGTVLVLHQSTVLPPNGPTYCHILASTVSSNSSAYYGWILMLGNGNGYLQFRTYEATSSTSIAAADGSVALNDGKPHVSIATWTTDIGAVLTTYVDGAVYAVSSPTSIATHFDNPIMLGAARDTFWGYLDGNIYLVATWNRVLTANEIASVSVNPWQLFARNGLTYPTSSLVSASVAVALKNYARFVSRLPSLSFRLPSTSSPPIASGDLSRFDQK